VMIPFSPLMVILGLSPRSGTQRVESDTGLLNGVSSGPVTYSNG
jgi:hypothetical protein